MRIVYHHRTRATDAQKVHITEILNAFRSLGHSAEVVSLVETENARHEAAEEAKQAAWQRVIRKIPLAYELAQLGYNAIGLPLLLVRLVRERPDFIYERYALFNFTGVLAARLLKIPLILEVNSPFALEQGRDGEIRAVRFAAWTERVICNAAARVIVVTAPLQKIMIRNGVHADRLVVMTNGVNLSRFSRRAGAASLRKRLGLGIRTVIGFVGWFRNWHGLDMLIEAFHGARLAEQGAVLLLIGDGPAATDLRRQIDSLGLRDSVILTGAVPHEEVPSFLDLIDIAVQPAANEYCCPMKIIEYMALGKPVVAPRQENIQEILREGEEALLFAPGDSRALGMALAELVGNGEAARKMGVRAQNAIENRGYLWVRNAERVIDLVQESRSAGRAMTATPLDR
jgi:glycosyltransferase involved in cell wall biosynthesis